MNMNKDVLLSDIEDMPIRAVNALKRHHNVTTLKELSELTNEQIYSTPGITRNNYKTLIEQINLNGIPRIYSKPSKNSEELIVSVLESTFHNYYGDFVRDLYSIAYIYKLDKNEEFLKYCDNQIIKILKAQMDLTDKFDRQVKHNISIHNGINSINENLVEFKMAIARCLLNTAKKAKSLAK